MTIKEYLKQAETNLQLMSRTAQGIIDTGTSLDKITKMSDGLTAEIAAKKAFGNYRRAIYYAFQRRKMEITDTDCIRQLAERLAEIVNTGILKKGILIRSGVDTTKYPYTPVFRLISEINQFYGDFYYRLVTNYNPVVLAAWVEWRIDLRDHFFADGCGKSAKAISSWILMHYDLPLPDYTAGGKIPLKEARKRYYSYTPDYIRTTDPVKDEIDFEKFAAYYRSLFSS